MNRNTVASSTFKENNPLLKDNTAEANQPHLSLKEDKAVLITEGYLNKREYTNVSRAACYYGRTIPRLPLVMYEHLNMYGHAIASQEPTDWLKFCSATVNGLWKTVFDLCNILVILTNTFVLYAVDKVCARLDSCWRRSFSVEYDSCLTFSIENTRQLTTYIVVSALNKYWFLLP